MKQTVLKSIYLAASHGLSPAFMALLAVCLLMPPVAKAAEPEKKIVKTNVKKPTASRTELKSKANQLAAGVSAAEQALTPDELAIAQRVEVGEVACELGVTVSVKADPRLPGYFDVQGKKFKFRMVPVVTSTGAIRLQDEHAGAVWLQLANKSMLMSQKLGSRLADNCMSLAQTAVAQAMEKNPPASLLEPVQIAKKAVVPVVSSTTPIVSNAPAASAPAAISQ